jgi:hypothetical protein
VGGLPRFLLYEGLADTKLKLSQYVNLQLHSANLKTELPRLHNWAVLSDKDD